MGSIFEAKDPRGIKIYCSESQWIQHIIPPETGHPIMKENIDAIIETLSSPDNIYESHDSEPPLEYREVYSKEVKDATYYNYTPYTKVIVTVLGGCGEVITAYNSKNPVAGVKGEAIYVGSNKD